MEAPQDERSQDQSGRGSSLKSLLEGTNKELILLIASFVVMSILAVLIVFLIAGPKSSDPTAKKRLTSRRKTRLRMVREPFLTKSPANLSIPLIRIHCG